MSSSNAPDIASAEIESHSKKNIIFGTVLGYLSLGLSIISGFVFTPWIISTLGTSSYGVYTLVNSLIALFAADFGLSAVANTMLSNYRASGEKEKEKQCLSSIYKIYLIADVALFLIFIVVYFLIDSIFVGLNFEERDALRKVFLISASFSLIAFPAAIFNGILSAYEEFTILKILDVISRILYVIITTIMLVCGYGLFGLVLGQAASNFVVILLKYIVIRCRLKIRGNLFVKASSSDVKLLFSYIVWSAICAICSRLIFNVTPSILGIVSDSKNISIFGIVVIIEGYVYTFGSIMNGFFLPKVQRLLKQKDSTKRIENLAIKVGKIQFLILGLAVIGFICVGKEFLMVWMHGDTSFVPAYYGTVIVVVYQTVNVPEIVFYNAMFSNKETIKHLGIISIIKALVNLVLSFVFSHFFGAIGACISIGIARSIELLLLNICYRKDLGVSLSHFFREVYVQYVPAIVVSTALGLLIHFFYQASDFQKLILNSLCIASSFLFLSLLFLPKTQKRSYEAWKGTESYVGAKKTIKRMFAPILSGAVLLSLVITSFTFFLKTDLGVFGTYVFSYQSQKKEEIVLTFNNYLTKTVFNDGTGGEDTVERFRWKYAISTSDLNKYTGVLDYVSKDQIQVCSDSWTSYYQFFLVDGKLYTKVVYPDYGGIQKCYTKQ